MADIIKTTFQVKRGTAARWEELNLILNPGEPGFEMDTFKLKIGNGSTPWKELPYVNDIDIANVQPDWNQNDETAADYIKNRPFYTGNPVETVLVEESTVAFADSGNGFYAVQVQSTFVATVGEAYKVYWDGSAYECTCVAVSESPLLFIGNLSIIGMGSDTGEPFIIGVFNGEGIQIATTDTSASHTFSVSGMLAPVVKIDPKYLPMPIPFKPVDKSYLTFSSPYIFTLKVNDATKHWDGILEYFASDKTWSTWDGTSALSAVYNDGEYVLYLRGTGNTKITGLNADEVSDTYRWVLTGSDIACVGNIENLLDYATVESGQHPMMAEACYGDMFYGCTSLTKAPALPATTLAIGCYFGMFQGCTSLSQAPALPATTLDTSCYALMFSGCTALIQAPELPATTLAMGCYLQMFPDCTSLTQAPALPATTLAMGCYSSMFQNCTALIQAPALLATTLANSCYGSMFYGCTSLTKAPALPATTLADYCYVSMFEGCTALTQAPALPADTLANDCYESMFWGCTGLKLSSSKTGEYTQEYRIPTTGIGTTATDALTNMFTSTGGTFTGTPEINTTYYLSTDNMIVRETEIATLNGYVGSMIDDAIDEYASIAEYIIPSSTTGSTKKFKITVDDSGTLTATEVT